MNATMRTAGMRTPARAGYIAFQLLLGLGWLLLLYVSAEALRRLGYAAAGSTFFGDLAHPWRAQFNIDFGLHLLLVAAWMIYRSRSWFAGVLCGLLAICVGGLFTMGYLLVISIRAKGDPRMILLGWRTDRHP